MMELEICVDNIESAVIADRCGATRLEVCTIGDLTPSTEFIKNVKRLVSIPIYVMIRPRQGDFQYNEKELKVMLQSICELKKINVDGFVFGALNKNNTIDTDVCNDLLKATSGLPATYSRAFDLIKDKKKALEELIALKFHRVLTSAGGETAEDGIHELRELVTQAGKRIIVVPGGGVREKNIRNILQETGASEIHSAAKIVDPNTGTKYTVCSVFQVENMKKYLKLEEERRMWGRMLQVAAAL